MCDSGDLGVHSDPQSPLADGQPVVVLYDMAPGGIGLSPRLYELHAGLLARAHELVRDCPCTEGCPSCVGPAGLSVPSGLPGAPEQPVLGGKAETLAILRAIGG
jgi:DEAD/DEAH box helicase domain-containing protein